MTTLNLNFKKFQKEQEQFCEQKQGLIVMSGKKLKIRCVGDAL